MDKSRATLRGARIGAMYPSRAGSAMASALLGILTLLAPACARHSALLTPSPQSLSRAAPDSFRVELQTSRGRVVVLAHRAWSPLGVDRLYYLVRHGYYDGTRFFRVVPGFVVQWGLTGDSALNAAWKRRLLPDERVAHSNTRGTLSYARGGPNTRGVQLYVNLADNPRLDTLNRFGFPPIGEVVEGMALLDSMYAGYSCRRGSQGTCPSQDSIALGGDRYLARVHPLLDFIRRARVRRNWRS
jgi:cyclophilin family peptidyl-prolyl cis-trans isomerase